MPDSLLAVGTALWLGVLTSISPCPLASNIAAVSIIGRRLADPRQALAAGLNRMVVDELLRHELRECGLVHARQFSWPRTARETARVYRQALAEGEGM